MRKILLVGCIIVSGCATYGTPINQEKISQIKEGVTTKQEVINLLGNPNTDTLNGDGSEILMYVYSNYKTRPSTYVPVVGLFTGGGNMQQQTFQVLIDKNGKVEKSVASNSASDINSGILNSK